MRKLCNWLCNYTYELLLTALVLSLIASLVTDYGVFVRCSDYEKAVAELTAQVYEMQADIEALRVVPEMEDPFEAEKIEAALVEQGYFREAVPLDYTLQDVLYTACEAIGVSREVGIALIEQESDFNPKAISPSGCYGLCQLNPKYFPSELSDADNIKTGIAYLGEQLERYDGDLRAALTGYRYGHDNGRRGYADEVLAKAEKWEVLYV